MNSMNLHASIHNLIQMDRHQEDTHRTPVLEQTQNARMAREQAARRTEAPYQPDEAEGKNVDSEAKKRYHREAARRKRKEKKRRESRGRAEGAGRFVDVTV